MCKREGIFFGILIFWLLMVMAEITVFPVFAKEYGLLFNIVPVLILMVIITPRYFSKRYNNWLESDLIKNKEQKND